MPILYKDVRSVRCLQQFTHTTYSYLEFSSWLRQHVALGSRKESFALAATIWNSEAVRPSSSGVLGEPTTVMCLDWEWRRDRDNPSHRVKGLSIIYTHNIPGAQKIFRSDISFANLFTRGEADEPYSWMNGFNL